ncbi:MAG: abortive infection family protein [Bacteroidia bacterium]|nr:abortive infection family protein [Bacteroidia bacterium]
MGDFWEMLTEMERNPDLSDFQTDMERAEYLQRLLINQSTNDGPANNDHYVQLRKYFLEKPEHRVLVPTWVRTNRDLSQFWQFIKFKFSTYAERREFVWSEFSPLLEAIESSTDVPHEIAFTEALKEFNSEQLIDLWNKNMDRKNTDPDGAITAAKSLLESVFKHILDDLAIDYSSNSDLHDLYKKVAENLNLSASQHEEHIFKQILGSCSGVVSGMSRLRNAMGDAHGQGRKNYRATPRHAQLAVNLAGSVALFVLETYKDRK